MKFRVSKVTRPVLAACMIVLLTAKAPAVAGPREEARTRIEAALTELHTLDFTDAQLKDVLRFLSEAANIQIVLDKAPLSDAGVSADTLVSIKLKGVSLESVVNLLLREFDLTFVIRDEVLMITTESEANNQFETVVYPVDDLAPTGRRSGFCESRLEPLMELIETTIAPDRWLSVGGRGTMAPEETRNALAISQTRQIHREISDLLAKLRATPPPAKQEVAKAADPSGYELRVYDVVRGRTFWGMGGGLLAVPEESTKSQGAMMGGGAKKAEEGTSNRLAEMIPKLMGPTDWDPKNTNVSIAAFESKLAIRQTPAVHAKIESLLEDLLD